MGLLARVGSGAAGRGLLLQPDDGLREAAPRPPAGGGGGVGPSPGERGAQWRAGAPGRPQSAGPAARAARPARGRWNSRPLLRLSGSDAIAPGCRHGAAIPLPLRHHPAGLGVARRTARIPHRPGHGAGLVGGAGDGPPPGCRWLRPRPSPGGCGVGGGWRAAHRGGLRERARTGP